MRDEWLGDSGLLDEERDGLLLGRERLDEVWKTVEACSELVRRMGFTE